METSVFNDFFVYDDMGTLATVSIVECESEKASAVHAVDKLINWTYEELSNDEADFDSGDLNKHLSELNELKQSINLERVDIESRDWYTTDLGFTFSRV